MERILIDGNSVGHAAHQGVVLKAGDQETQAVFGTIKSIRKYRTRYPHAQIIILWDGDSWRKRESTVYKTNRTDTPEKIQARQRYKDQAPSIRKALRLLGVPQIAARNYEADDLAALMVPKYLAQGDFVRLLTGDRDWWQLLSQNCVWEDHRDETRKVTIAGLESASAYSSKHAKTKVVTTISGVKDVRQYLECKALHGDVSDSLPGVGAIGEKFALELIKTWGSVSWFLADPDRAATYKEKNDGNIPKCFTDFASMPDRQEKFFHNMRMMSLLDPPPAADRLILDKGEFNPEGFKRLCQELAFVSIYRPEAFEQWVAPFKPK